MSGSNWRRFNDNAGIHLLDRRTIWPGDVNCVQEDLVLFLAKETNTENQIVRILTSLPDISLDCFRGAGTVLTLKRVSAREGEG